MRHPGNDALPTIRDVATAAGVSRATASRALADYGIVNALTREKVLAAAAELGYVANVLARAMRAGSTQTLGLIITEVGLSVFDLAIRAVIEAAHLRGYQVLVANTNEDLGAERDSVRVMLEKQVDGLILVPSAVSDLDFISPAALHGKPVVLLDRTLDELELPSVSADNHQGAVTAVGHLIERGHQKIALVVATTRTEIVSNNRPVGLVSTLYDRVDGYHEAMAGANLSVDEGWLVYSPDTGAAALSAVHGLLNSANPPTAIIASNADVSLSILRVAKERGLTVGVDISVIGFDDAPWAPVLTPALTVIDLPIEAMAMKAVDVLVAQIASGSRSHSIGPIALLPMQLLVRESVAQLPVPA